MADAVYTRTPIISGDINGGPYETGYYKRK